MPAESVKKILASVQTQCSSAVSRELETFLATMVEHGNRREDPVRSVFARLGDRWSFLLLQFLRVAPFRHAALKRLASAAAPAGQKPISQRMLTLRLRALERDGVVRRKIMPVVPPAVEYSLTPLGRDLMQKVHGLALWVCDNDAEIRQARLKFDRAGRAVPISDRAWTLSDRATTHRPAAQSRRPVDRQG